MKPTASIIIPTWNNPDYLGPCIKSIIATGVLDGLCELIVINNGIQNLDFLKDFKNIKVLSPGKNLGWEGGLALGLKHAQGDFICFQNDDTLIPSATNDFYTQLLWPFGNKNVAAVGPSTTVAAGWHSIFRDSTPKILTEVTYLIFFTVMVRRSDLEAAGGIDTSAPGGDDLDLCMRFRKLGKSVLVNPDAFIIHHAFKTGERVHGTSDKPYGWNSKGMSDRTNRWLIQKHGFKMYMETLRGFSYQQGVGPDTEGDAVRHFVRGQNIIELGCGYQKTVPQAIGVDQASGGVSPSHLSGSKSSVADIQADVTKRLPFDALSVDTAIARHILEHSIDTIQTLKHWNSVLKMEGRLIIAVPNQEIISSIPLNPEHVHAFTPESLKNSVELCGFKQVETVDPGNGISLVSCFEKVLHVEPIGEVVEKIKPSNPNDPDTEGACIRERISPDCENIVDLGCGTRRTHPKAVCYDQLAKGTPVPNVYPPGVSIADFVCDVSKELPIPSDSQDAVIARHVIEHVPHTEETLKEWMRILKKNGLLYLAVPDDDLGDTLHMDHDHKHAFTKESIKQIMENMGWKTVELVDPKNGVSFVGIWEKVNA